MLLLAALAVTAAMAALLKEKPESKAQLGQRTSPASSSGPSSGQDRSSSASFPLETVEVEKAGVPTVLDLTGQLQADEQSDVASRGTGIVQEAFIERGSFVKKGTVLIRLDLTDANNRLREAEAALAELALRLGLNPDTAPTTTTPERFDVARQPDVLAAQAAYELSSKAYQRDRELIRQKVISAAEIDKSRMQAESDRQRLDMARREALRLYGTYRTALTRLATARQEVIDAEVRAPFDGVIAERHVALGEMIQPGGRVATLVRVDPLRLVLTIPERQVGLVQEGQEVTFSVVSLPGRTFQGTVRFVAPALSERSRSLSVEALVANPDRLLRPGFFANARLKTGATRQSFQIPESAVRRAGDTARVFVAVDGRLRERLVTLGDAHNGRLEVKTGLTATDRVAVQAAQATDGAPAR